MRRYEQTLVELDRRHALVLVVLLGAFVVLACRVVYVQVVNREFLQAQGNLQHLREVKNRVTRAMVTDRHGEALAVSTPLQSVVVSPKTFDFSSVEVRRLAHLLGMTQAQLVQRVRGPQDNKLEFIYLKRMVTPALIAEIQQLNIPGVSLKREYRRYYPSGEVAAHVVGYTDIDEKGKAGIELIKNKQLSGTTGIKRVHKDRIGFIVDDVEHVQPRVVGQAVELSIDHRLQYLAYRELKAAVLRHRAKSGALVMIDITTGEILALVNQPSYNPNDRKQFEGHQFHEREVNRVASSLFEPGSTIKPFVIAAALQSGLYRSTSTIDTSPGQMELGSRVIRDTANNGVLDLSGVLTKSSNVGISKLALTLGATSVWRQYQILGLGQITETGLPGEQAGVLHPYQKWNEQELASAAYGYGLSTSLLQLVQAYGVIASDGYLRPLTIFKRPASSEGKRVMSAAVAQQVRDMLEQVTAPGGTGHYARVSGYRVAGKTGTVRKVIPQTLGKTSALTKSKPTGYSSSRYMALFAGIAPASNPRLAMVVLIDEPDNGEYYGGKVAAPVFSEVMRDALRLLNVPPDNLPVDKAIVNVKFSGPRT